MFTCIIDNLPADKRRRGVSQWLGGEQCAHRNTAGRERGRDEHGATWATRPSAPAGPRRGRAPVVSRRCRLRHHLPQRRQLLSRAMRVLASHEPRISRASRVALVARVRPRSPLPRRRLRGDEALRALLRQRSVRRAQTPRRSVAVAPRGALRQITPRSGPDAGLPLWPSLSPNPAALTPMRLSTEVPS